MKDSDALNSPWNSKSWEIYIKTHIQTPLCTGDSPAAFRALFYTKFSTQRLLVEDRSFLHSYYYFQVGPKFRSQKSSD